MTAYGRAALEQLRDTIREAKGGDPLRPVTVLVPNNIAGIVARRFLVQGLGDGHAGVAALFPTTIARLAEQLAAPRLHPRRPATTPVVAASWRAALSKSPGVFAEVANHPATVEALVRAGRELRDLDDVALSAVATATSLSPDLIRLYRDVRDGLTSSWYDETDLLRAATDIATSEPQRVAEIGTVVLYLPQALTQAEAGFVQALSGTGQLRVVAGLTGNAKADAAVLRSLDRIDVAAPEAPAVPMASRVLTASDADDEVRCIVRDVVRALKTRKAHRVAVLYAARNPYARLLHEHLAAAGITVNGPGTRPVHERAVARAVLELLELATNEVPRADLFRVLAAAPMRTTDGDRIPVSRWERLSRTAGVVQGDDWDLRLRRYADDHREHLEQAKLDGASTGLVARLESDVHNADQLRAFATGLRGELHRGAQLTSWRELSDWALDLVHSLIGEAEELTRLPVEEQDAAAALEQSLRALGTLDSLGAPAALPALRETLASQLESALPRVGRFGDGVLVAPVSAAVGLEADIVFVLGLAESLYPGRLREDPLLPERARDASAGQLLSYRERIDTAHRALLAAFAAAPEVVASFPRGDLRTKSRHLPSRWLLPTLRELSGNQSLSATQWDKAPIHGLTTSPSFAGSLTTTPDPACEQEWRIQASHAGVRLDDAVVAAAQELSDGRDSCRFTRFDGDLSAVAEGLPDYAAGERAVSPTALEKYAGCPHAYFIERILGVQPVEQPEDVITISPADIGTLMHESFDALVTEFADDLPGFGEPWRDDHRRRLAEIADVTAARFADDGRTGHPRLWQQTLVRVQADLQAMLVADDEWRAEHRARVLASELAFGMHGADPVAVLLPDGGTLLMRGSADKVDETEDGRLVVTDIKSGSATSFKGLSADDPVLGGSKLQLPVYAHAARQAYDRPDDEVEAAYWFVRKDKGRIAVPLTPEVEQVYAETLQTIVAGIRGGLFPARPPEKDDYAYVQCAYCNPDGIGHGQARSRWLRTKRDPRLAELVALIEPLPAADTDGDDA
ncbi:PD-(D/E)XK nuclease family protein [Blastococcus sp. TML/M2B]|uniref:PD-(D/E)XK nuclease family protein n=1 Tax=unclassified Blastococcus TaxID=2619396 RepID=UPI00190D497F|nr:MULTISPECIES: PD-(D/E)XK nuclease family protein [unclassified Blastococcus]MBN1093327.1 PD-(D/E)XK nuclease family protein [Blastococcus sp. TML/M2B]MBN1096557.1 PD-(D/E)XK nuclease family protein [Blastococcus sp. TML/C7B]